MCDRHHQSIRRDISSYLKCLAVIPSEKLIKFGFREGEDGRSTLARPFNLNLLLARFSTVPMSCRPAAIIFTEEILDGVSLALADGSPAGGAILFNASVNVSLITPYVTVGVGVEHDANSTVCITNRTRFELTKTVQEKDNEYDTVTRAVYADGQKILRNLQQFHAIETRFEFLAPLSLDTGNISYTAATETNVTGHATLITDTTGLETSVGFGQKFSFPDSGVIGMEAIHFVMFTKQARTIKENVQARKLGKPEKAVQWCISKGKRSSTWNAYRRPKTGSRWWWTEKLPIARTFEQEVADSPYQVGVEEPLHVTTIDPNQPVAAPPGQAGPLSVAAIDPNPHTNRLSWIWGVLSVFSLIVIVIVGYPNILTGKSCS
jgi:hypothetical protein